MALTAEWIAEVKAEATRQLRAAPTNKLILNLNLLARYAEEQNAVIERLKAEIATLKLKEFKNGT